MFCGTEVSPISGSMAETLGGGRKWLKPHLHTSRYLQIRDGQANIAKLVKSFPKKI
jgi:hypothetical protein